MQRAPFNGSMDLWSSQADVPLWIKNRDISLKSLLMPLFLKRAVFKGIFERENGLLRHARKRPIKVGERPFKQGKGPIKVLFH